MLQYLIVSFAIFGGFIVFAVSAMQLAAPKPRDAMDYLKDLDDVEVHEEYHTLLALPIHMRVVDWLRDALIRRRRHEAGMMRAYRRKVHKELVLAGIDDRAIPEMILVAQIVAGSAMLVVAVVLMTAAVGFGMNGLFVTVALVGAGLYVPRLALRRAARARSQQIARDLPDIVELAAMGMRAGLGVDAAFGAVIQDYPGPLADEMQRFLDDISLGTPRQQALMNVKERTDVRILSQLITTLSQADEMGMPIATVLRSAAGEARLRRQQEAREKAARLPVKMLLPLVFCIFPPVLVIIVGPAMSSISSVLG